MVIFLYNLYIFEIRIQKIVLYPKQCYNEQCCKGVYVYSKYKVGASFLLVIS